MVIKQFLVWVLETAVAALLLGVLMYWLLGPFNLSDAHGSLVDALRYTAVALVIFMWGSGYLFTTAIAALVGRIWWPKLYPIAAMVLFVLHVEFYWSGWKDSANPTMKYESLVYQYFGACIVFGCDSLGNVLLRRWGETRKKE